MSISTKSAPAVAAPETEHAATGENQRLTPTEADWRYLENGHRIPLPTGYLDQPYFVRANDGALVLVCTNCPSHEGDHGQHVVCIRSEDNGKTWSPPYCLEPPDGVEASYAVILKTTFGRIYVFYNHNTDNIRSVPCDKEASPDGLCRRVDSLGYFVFKYSDDHGKTWSSKRHTIPVREYAIDRENTSGGKIRYFWNVGKAFWHAGKGYVPLHKVGGFGADFFTRSEGCLICIPNLDKERNPENLEFLTLPDGDVGIRPPKGSGLIGEEHCFVTLSDDTLFTVFRTVSGHAGCAYSRDNGHSWTPSTYLRFPDGRKVKNPRAANFIWKLSDNRYLYWFHNHSGRNYADRNPVWCLAAREVSTPDGNILEFSQPEILLYTDDITRRMSYPDCLELECGDLLLTETEKQIARMHRIPAAFLRTIGHQWSQPPIPEDGEIVVDAEGGLDEEMSVPLELPLMYDRKGSWEEVSGGDLRAGFSITIETTENLNPGKLFDNRDVHGCGFALILGEDRRLKVILADKRSESHWGFAMPLNFGEKNDFSIIVDGGPKVVFAVINGLFDDGGERQFGFGLFHPFLIGVNGTGIAKIKTGVSRLLIHNRALLTAEAMALHFSRVEELNTSAV
jgi:hypothetical protein